MEMEQGDSRGDEAEENCELISIASSVSTIFFEADSENDVEELDSMELRKNKGKGDECCSPVICLPENFMYITGRTVARSTKRKKKRPVEHIKSTKDVKDMLRPTIQNLDDLIDRFQDNCTLQSQDDDEKGVSFSSEQVLDGKSPKGESNHDDIEEIDLERIRNELDDESIGSSSEEESEEEGEDLSFIASEDDIESDQDESYVATSSNGSSSETELDAGDRSTITEGIQTKRNSDSPISVQSDSNDFVPEKNRDILDKPQESGEEDSLHCRNDDSTTLTEPRRKKLMKLFLEEFNASVFKGAIPATLEITWNVRLRKTAGLTYTSTNLTTKERVARIELSSKVVDTPFRLFNTLLHECCHVAAWLVQGQNRPPHGPSFKYWATIGTKAYPDCPVTTRHSYAIHAKFRYECTRCGASFRRHSKSLDVEKQVCGACHGKIRFLGSFNRDGTPAKAKLATGFSLFVKEKYGQTRGQASSHKHAMEILGKQWKDSRMTSTPGASPRHSSTDGEDEEIQLLSG